MAIIAIILGSLVGVAGGVIGWAFLGMSVLTAVTFYFGCSLTTLLLAIAANLRQGSAETDSSL
jgi:hypothetical protein